eukprot:scaffold6767_cov223-Isochrysis_galbana.AAC.4
MTGSGAGTPGRPAAAAAHLARPGAVRASVATGCTSRASAAAPRARPSGPPTDGAPGRSTGGSVLRWPQPLGGCWSGGSPAAGKLVRGRAAWQTAGAARVHAARVAAPPRIGWVGGGRPRCAARGRGALPGGDAPPPARRSRHGASPGVRACRRWRARLPGAARPTSGPRRIRAGPRARAPPPE